MNGAPANPYDAQTDLTRVLNALQLGTMPFASAAPYIAGLLARGLDLAIITAAIDRQIRLRQEDRRAAASRQKDLMELHAFVQGFHHAKTGGSI